MNKKYIKISCEYDINGSFGGNNNEEVVYVDGETSNEEIDAKVLAYVSEHTGESKEDLEDLCDWEVINIGSI